MEWLGKNWKKVVSLAAAAGIVVIGSLRLSGCDEEKLNRAQDIIEKVQDEVDPGSAE